ncbi:MAG: hypothetical protein RKK15_11840, partial [Defluviicoccus sp.]|nr:hypothetical protein [Defluviicoccus sp.]
LPDYLRKSGLALSRFPAFPFPAGQGPQPAAAKHEFPGVLPCLHGAGARRPPDADAGLTCHEAGEDADA